MLYCVKILSVTIKVFYSYLVHKNHEKEFVHYPDPLEKHLVTRALEIPNSVLEFSYPNYKFIITFSV
jgi:hypothetical protein